MFTLTAMFGAPFLGDTGTATASIATPSAPMQEDPQVGERVEPIGLRGIIMLGLLLIAVVGLILCPVLDWLALRAQGAGRTSRAGTLAITGGILSVFPFTIYFVFGILSMIAGAILTAHGDAPSSSRAPGTRPPPGGRAPV